MDSKPSIIEVIGRRVELRRAGREFVGLCPFHDDRHPSLYVNADKGVFLCRACQEHGDVIDFIMMIDGLTFPQAKAALGIENSSRYPAPTVTLDHNAAILLASWLNTQHLLVGARCRELSRQIAIADQIPDRALSIRLRREWAILGDLHDDLADPNLAAELWDSRDFTEALTVSVELESLDDFPPLTQNYRNFLVEVVR